MFSKESHAGTMDNICGAVAKMITVNPNAVPLEAVIISNSALISVTFKIIFRYSLLYCNIYR